MDEYWFYYSGIITPAGAGIVGLTSGDERPSMRQLTAIAH